MNFMLKGKSTAKETQLFLFSSLLTAPVLERTERQEEGDEAARWQDRDHQAKEEDLALLYNEIKNGNKAKKIDRIRNIRVRNNCMSRPEQDV